MSGYMTPYGRSRSLSFCMLTPGPTVTVRWSRSMSVIASMRLMSTRIPWRSGTAPSTRPVPPARGTSGMLRSLASRTIAATSSVLPGSTTTCGTWSSQRCTANIAGVRARL